MHTETLECWAARLLRLLSLAAESCLLDVKLPPAPVLIILIIDVDVAHANFATSRLDTTRLDSEFLGRADLSVLSPGPACFLQPFSQAVNNYQRSRADSTRLPPCRRKTLTCFRCDGRAR